jgi:hypothetical protein
MPASTVQKGTTSTPLILPVELVQLHAPLAPMLLTAMFAPPTTTYLKTTPVRPALSTARAVTTLTTASPAAEGTTLIHPTSALLVPSMGGTAWPAAHLRALSKPPVLLLRFGLYWPS